MTANKRPVFRSPDDRLCAITDKGLQRTVQTAAKDGLTGHCGRGNSFVMGRVRGPDWANDSR